MQKNHFLNWGWSVADTPAPQLRRVRSLVCACFALIVVALPFMARSIQWGLSTRIILIGSAIVLGCLALILLRRRYYVLSVHCLALGVYLAGVNQYITVGGMESGAVTWWMIVPLVGGLLSGLNAGVIWALICLSTGLILFYLETHGVPFPNLTPPESRNVQRVMIMVGEFFALVAVMVAYLTQIEGSERALRRRNEQLLTQVQRAEAAEASALEAADAKGRFLANMTHELRTPLNSILGFTNRVMNQLEGRIEPRQFEALKMVSDSGDQMLKLVSDLLDLSDLDAGRLEMSHGLIDLQEMLNVLEPRLRLHAQRSGLTLEFEAMPEAFTQGDVSHIKRVIETTIGHALQYCSEGTVRVQVRVEQGQWQMEVHCERMALDEGQLQRIFDRYHHLHSAGDRPAVVSGLAMVLARELAELHAGSLTVQNKTGSGVVYTLTLPNQ